MNKETASIREFAKIMDRSETMVRKWIAKGKISKKYIDYSEPKRPLIFIDAARRELIANRTDTYNSTVEKRTKSRTTSIIAKPELGTNWSRSPAGNSAILEKKPGKVGRPKSKEKPKVDAWGEPVEPDESELLEMLNSEMSTADMMRLTIGMLEKLKRIREIQRMEQQYQKEARILVPLAEVEKYLYEAAQNLKEAIGNVAARVIDHILAAKDRDEAVLLLEDELDLALNTTADIGDTIERLRET